MARMIASAIRSSWRQRLTAASKSPMRSACVISPSTSVGPSQSKPLGPLEELQEQLKYNLTVCGIFNSFNYHQMGPASNF